VTSARSQDEERLFEVSVAGTGLVMEACVRADVERVVYTSSAAVVGPAARGQTADEGQLLARGLQLVCVNPGVCFGPGDHLRSPTRACALLLLGRVPVHVDGAASIVDAREHDRIARTRGSQHMTRRLAGVALGAAELAAGLQRRARYRVPSICGHGHARPTRGRGVDSPALGTGVGAVTR
jgi:dihydroflavonol-4-reductase